MGQYFTPVFLNSTGTIMYALNPNDYGSDDKHFGHSRADTRLLYAVQSLLSLDGSLRLVWAGEYAEPEPGGDANLYYLTEQWHFMRIAGLLHPDCREPVTMACPDPERRNVFGYTLNHDKHAFVDHMFLPVDHTGWRRCPLPRLTAEAGADAQRRGQGSWARDRLSYTHQRPAADWTDSTDA